MKYHYTYRIVNLATGNYYLGCHTTSNLQDGYMGSGVLIGKAIKFYGVMHFKKIVLCMYSTRAKMFRAERRLITRAIVDDPFSYNLITGGKRKSKNTYKCNARIKNCDELLR